MSATTQNNRPTTTDSDCQKCRNDVKQFTEMTDKQDVLFDEAKLNYSIPLESGDSNYRNDTNISDVFIEYKTYKINTYWWNPFRGPEAICTGTTKLMLPHCKSVNEIRTAIRQTHRPYDFTGWNSFITNNYITKIIYIGVNFSTRNPQFTIF